MRSKRSSTADPSARVPGSVLGRAGKGRGGYGVRGTGLFKGGIIEGMVAAAILRDVDKIF